VAPPVPIALPTRGAPGRLPAPACHKRSPALVWVRLHRQSWHGTRRPASCGGPGRHRTAHDAVTRAQARPGPIGGAPRASRSRFRLGRPPSVPGQPPPHGSSPRETAQPHGREFRRPLSAERAAGRFGRTWRGPSDLRTQRLVVPRPAVHPGIVSLRGGRDVAARGAPSRPPAGPDPGDPGWPHGRAGAAGQASELCGSGPSLRSGATRERGRSPRPRARQRPSMFTRDGTPAAPSARRTRPAPVGHYLGR